MKIVIAIDSFKGSLSSLEAGTAAAEGIKRVFPHAECTVLPVADGGEGTAAALVSGMGGETVSVQVTGPLGSLVNASYGIIREKNMAVMEMASAAGLTLVPPELRDPMVTTTYGVGEMISDAVRRGMRHFVIGIGGSATNDGGAGMLDALGFDFLTADGTPIPRGARGLGDLCSVSAENALPELAECNFKIACDVTNPLCGEFGCSAVFSPQKGASPNDVPVMDAYLASYARLAAGLFPSADPQSPGAGAAGGLGFAFSTFLGGALMPGVDMVLEATGLERHLEGADLVITGEGRLDSQTVMGKAPAGVARAAKSRGIPVIALAGCIGEDAYVCNAHGIDAYFPVLRRIVTAEEAMETTTARNNLADTTEQIMRAFAINYKE